MIGEEDDRFYNLLVVEFGGQSLAVLDVDITENDLGPENIEVVWKKRGRSVCGAFICDNRFRSPFLLRFSFTLY